MSEHRTYFSAITLMSIKVTLMSWNSCHYLSTQYAKTRDEGSVMLGTVVTQTT